MRIMAVVRTDFDPATEGPGRFYRLLNSVVVPRPIAWVSSTSADGVDNLAPEPMFEQINETATDYQPEMGEFDAAGVEREPSALVRPPRVAGSPVALECQLHRIVPVGDCHLILGEVLRAAIRTDVLVDGHPDVRRLRPLGPLGRDEWCTVRD